MSIELEGTIKIKVGDQEVKMTIEDAKSLSNQLNNLFNIQQITWPYTSPGTDQIFPSPVITYTDSSGNATQLTSDFWKDYWKNQNNDR